jgi:hypothetical protein
MKMPISWHRQVITNLKSSLEQLRDRVVRAQFDYDACAKRVAILNAQITRAEREGRDGFDAEKFNLSRVNAK